MTVTTGCTPPEEFLDRWTRYLFNRQAYLALHATMNRAAIERCIEAGWALEDLIRGRADYRWTY